jgi:hypothetical protein
MCLVCYSVVLLGRETGSLQLLAPLLLTGGKGADLVIRGDVILNTRNMSSVGGGLAAVAVAAVALAVAAMGKATIRYHRGRRSGHISM